MSSVIRQDYWNVMPRLQDEINRLFGNARENDSSSATATWVPLVDIHEYSDRFELYVDLPGVEPSKVELTLDSGILTLSGVRPEQGASVRERTCRRAGPSAEAATSIAGSCCRIRSTAKKSTPRGRTGFDRDHTEAAEGGAAAHSDRSLTRGRRRPPDRRGV